MLDFIFIILISQVDIPLVIEVDDTQAEVVRTDYIYNEDPRRVVARFDDIFSDGFEGGEQ